jgi:hypothetical protein
MFLIVLAACIWFDPAWAMRIVAGEPLLTMGALALISPVPNACFQVLLPIIAVEEATG